MPKIKLILASGSPRRKELLSHLGIPFEIMIKNTPEESSETDPVKFSSVVARLKGEAVFEEVKRKDENTIVVSADTIVCHEGKIYGKPRNKDEAREILSTLGGQTHSVFTAVAIHFCLKNQTDLVHFVEESRVSFNEISQVLMEQYLSTGDSLDKAGAYGIQGPSLTFISKVEGDYANVVGFPLSRFVIELEKILFSYFPDEGTWPKLF